MLLCRQYGRRRWDRVVADPSDATTFLKWLVEAPAPPYRFQRTHAEKYREREPAGFYLTVHEGQLVAVQVDGNAMRSLALTF